MKRCVRGPLSRSAFSLVEVLLATAILGMIVVGASQLINSASTATLGAGKRMDCDTQARLIMDRIGADLTAAIKRPDVDIYFNKQDGNDEMYFFSQANGYYGSSDPSNISVRNTVSLVGYRVDNRVSNGKTFALERLSRGLHWTNTGAATGQPSTLVYLPEQISLDFQPAINDSYNNSTNLSPANSSDVPEWDVIGNLVFRFEFCFLLKNTPGSGAGGYTANSGKLSLVPYDTTAGHSSANGLQDVEAIVVTFALLDSKSRTIVKGGASNAPELAPLVTLLPDADGVNNTADVWTKIVSSRSFSAAGIPASAGSQARIYQRYFYLNSYITN